METKTKSFNSSQSRLLLFFIANFLSTCLLLSSYSSFLLLYFTFALTFVYVRLYLFFTAKGGTNNKLRWVNQLILDFSLFHWTWRIISFNNFDSVFPLQLQSIILWVTHKWNTFDYIKLFTLSDLQKKNCEQ